MKDQLAPKALLTTPLQSPYLVPAHTTCLASLPSSFRLPSQPSSSRPLATSKPPLWHHLQGLLGPPH